MALGSKKNVIVGAARFFIGTAAAVKPAYGAGDYAATVEAATGWRNIGYTQEGVEVAYEPEYTGVPVDQVLDDVRTVKTGMRVSVNTTFAEATLENLIVAWGQADGTLTSSGADTQTVVIVPGELGEAPLERQLLIVGNGPERGAQNKYAERTYHATRAVSTESSSHALRRGEATVFPVSFRLMPDDAAGAKSPYGTITDRTRTW